MIRRRFIVLIGAALAGCAGPRKPAPVESAVRAPQDWRVPTNASANRLRLDWWKAFGDAALDALVAQAMLHSDDIALAAVNVDEARAELAYAQAQRMPNVQLAVDGGRERGVNPGFGIPDEQAAGEALVQASYDLDLFGRLKAVSAAARASLLASEDARQTVRLGVAATVVTGYFTLLALDAQLAIVRQTLQVRRDELRIEQHRFDAGYSTALDLTRAQAELESTAQRVPSLELGIARAENGLSILLGRVPGTIARPRRFDQLTLPEIPVALPSVVLRSRPDIAAAEARLAATDHALDAARAAFLPDIRLSAMGGFVGSTLVNASPVSVWSIGSSILAPLFDAGRLRSQQDLATARRDEAAFAYRKTVMQAFREVEDSLAAIAKYREQYESLSRTRNFLQRTFTLASSRYREGYATYLDQLDAQRNLLSAELSLVLSRLDRFDAAVSLIQALGGGWAPDSQQHGPEKDKSATG
ncbi:efflux transporter outer membrane subunit [Trinickia sp. EG282A]|uniref:efflux transporter outer membrane subunit n=1 Tax=Trinickia sp. EG282A TaxID=3237013 RepID=UPI0034D25487